MRQDFFTYQPLFKLVIAGNHKPAFRNVDPAIRRRLHLVPFLVTPRQVDRNLMEKLRAEGPGILAWMIAGTLAWQAEMLAPPAAVLSATQEYFQEEDIVGQWLAETCDRETDAFATTADLLSSYRGWCSETGEPFRSAKWLAQELKRREFRQGKHSRSRKNGFYGIRPNEPSALTALSGGQ
jgi:putative DNA primase/helicase